MGKISEIPKLRRALDERMAKLGGEGVGMSDKTADRAGVLGTSTPGSAAYIMSTLRSVPGVVSVGVKHDACTGKVSVDVGVRDGYDRESTEAASECRSVCRSTFLETIPAGIDVDLTFHAVPERRPAEPRSPQPTRVLFDGSEVGHLSAATFRAPTLPADPSDGPSTMTALLAENARLSDQFAIERRRANMADAEWQKWRNLYYAKLDEADALLREVQILRANAEKVKALRESMTRFDPATGREELFDPFAVLEDLKKQIPNDKRLEGYTLVGAVAEMARLLRSADTDAAVLSTLRSQRVEPGSLVTLSAPEGTAPAALKRLGDALHRELASRIGNLMSYGAPTVVLLPPGGQAQVVTPQGRGPVQVNIREPGAPARPTDVPKHVAQAYAEAAAASYGVTPTVVRAKRASRRLLRAVANRVNARIADGISPFITPEVRAERRPIGREVIAYDDPADLMLADAEG